MNNILTFASVVLVITSPLALATEQTPASVQALQDSRETVKMDRIENELQSELLEESPVPPESQPLPEPNGLVALAFAGVVILARHRFRP